MLLTTGNLSPSALTATGSHDDPLRAQLVGNSPVFLNALRIIRRAAASDATVLIEGETGTGKELAARAVHYLSDRRSHPFIPINCGALPDHLVENELFGHARGAYTDARENMKGLISEADRGTLFLDEVEALSAKAQVALLRFLQDGTFRPLGGQQLLHSHARIVAASNVDVAQLVAAGKLRADLMYRLRLMTVQMPPLRARTGDIVLVANHLLSKLSARYRQDKHLDATSIDVLNRYHWPGNVRELENVLHREFLLTDGAKICIRDHSFDPSNDHRQHATEDELPLTGNFRSAKARAVAEFERTYLIRALEQHAGNVSAAARSSGKDRRVFGRLLKKHRIDNSYR